MPTSTSEPGGTEQDLRALALTHGFDVCRFADAAAPWEAGHRLSAFLDAGHHGTMLWMETTRDRRAHPTAMWPDARTAIMLGVNYAPGLDPLARLADTAGANISVYALGDDYHDVIKKRLKALASAYHRQSGHAVKVFVDTAPLMEKPLAARAGLGWQGKHTNLVSRSHGSWLFLGSILTSAELTPDAPEIDHCGSCRACLDICPTQAFPAPYHLDARRCISYLTIEHAGPIPQAFRTAIGNRIYGCDDCLAVCPWNKFAQVSQHAQLAARDALIAPRLSALARLDDAGFRALFAKNPVKRIGLARFLRNVAIALGNSNDPDAIVALKTLLVHDAAIVRGAAVWALAKHMSQEDFSELARTTMAGEMDPEVRAEWSALA